MFFALLLALASPPDWVPARWNWTDPATLDLLQGTPVNCLLLTWNSSLPKAAGAFADKAAQRGVVTLAVIHPMDPVHDAARQAVRGAGMNGIVLEGDFPEGTADR